MKLILWKLQNLKLRPLNVSSHWPYHSLERSIPTLAHVRINFKKEKYAAGKRHTGILSSRERLRRKLLEIKICPENKEFRFFGSPLFKTIWNKNWNLEFFGILKLSLKIANVENLVKIFPSSESVQMAIECVGRHELKRLGQPTHFLAFWTPSDREKISAFFRHSRLLQIALDYQNCSRFVKRSNFDP